MSIVFSLVTVLFAIFFALVFFRMSYEVLCTSKQMQNTYMEIVGFLLSVILFTAGIWCSLVVIVNVLSLFN